MQIKPSTKTYIFYIRLCLSCVIFFYLISLIDFDRIRIIIPRLEIKYTWQAFLLLLLTNLAVSIRWSMLLGHFGIKQRIIDSWRFYMIGGFYSLVLPGVIGGDVVRLYLSVRTHSVSKALLATSIFFERFCGIMVILLMASAATLLVPVILETEQVVTYIILGLSIAVLFSFTLFFLVIKKFPFRWLENTNLLKSWNQQISTLLQNFRRLSISFISYFLLFSLLAHLFDIIGCFFLSRMLHINQPFSFFLLTMPIVYVLTILPISIGGIGVREGVLTFFLVKVGVLVSDAVLLALMIYLNRLLVGLIGGAVQFIEKKSLSMREI